MFDYKVKKIFSGSPPDVGVGKVALSLKKKGRRINEVLNTTTQIVRLVQSFIRFAVHPLKGMESVE